MAAKLVFFLRLEGAVSYLALSMNMNPVAEPVLGTFAFYVKGRRASPPAEKMTQQIEAQPGGLRPTSPIKAQTSQKGGPSKSQSLPVNEGNQDKEDLPKFKVLLVEDNLVNRSCLPPTLDVLALTVDQRKSLVNSYRKRDVLCTLRITAKRR